MKRRGGGGAKPFESAKFGCKLPRQSASKMPMQPLRIGACTLAVYGVSASWRGATFSHAAKLGWEHSDP